MSNSIASVSEVSAEVLESPIVIVRGLIDTQNPRFALKHLREQYGPRRVDMVRQRAVEDLPGNGWDLPPQYSHHSSLGPYIQKMLDEEEGRQKKKRKKERLLVFAANVDMDDMAPQCEALREMMPAYLRWGGDSDLLQLVRQAVPGVTKPQLYFKVRGNWTGGHEENLRLTSINCNHGPGSSRWYAVDSAHASALRSFVLKTESIDIYMREGNWWPTNLDALLEAGIPVRTGIQRPGDVVVLRGSTLHWVQAESASLHSSWNICVCDAVQIKGALQRADMNDLGSTCVPNIVFLKTLFCDVARALVDDNLLPIDTFPKRDPSIAGKIEHSQLSDNRRICRIRLLNRVRKNAEVVELIRACVARTLEKESTNVRKFDSWKNHQQEEEGSVVLRCDQCAAELPLVYARCETCLTSPEHTSQFFCADCAAIHRSNNCKHVMVAVSKGSLSELNSLAGRLERLRRGRDSASAADNEEKRRRAVNLLAGKALLAGSRINRQKPRGDAYTQTNFSSHLKLVNSRETYNFVNGRVVQTDKRAPVPAPRSFLTQDVLIFSQREKNVTTRPPCISRWNHPEAISARENEHFLAWTSKMIEREQKIRRIQRVRASEIYFPQTSAARPVAFLPIVGPRQQQRPCHQPFFTHNNTAVFDKERWTPPLPPPALPLFLQQQQQHHQHRPSHQVARTPAMQRRYQDMWWQTKNLTSVANTADPRFLSGTFQRPGVRGVA